MRELPHHTITRALIVGVLIIGGMIAGAAASSHVSPPIILPITPASCLSTVPVSIIDLTGTGFQPGATVKLARAGSLDIPATATNVVSETRITCTLDLTGVPPGVWDVVVTNTDGQSGTLTGGFTVLSPAPQIPGFPLTSSWGFPNCLRNLIGTGPVPHATPTLTPTGASGLEGVNGTISPGEITTVNYGSSQTYTITPDTGYRIADVLVNGESVGTVTSYTFTYVQANHTIRALFGINTYTITPSAGYGGSISPPVPVTVDYGSSVKVTITPDTGYHIADVLVDGILEGALTEYTFTNIQENHPISASFAINRYTITTAADSGGTIEPSGAVEVSYGSSPAITIIPDNGYHIATVTVDDSAVAVSPRYTFTDVVAPHTISTTFIPDPAIAGINPDTGKNGKTRPFTITGSGFMTLRTTRVALYYPGTSTVFTEGELIQVVPSTHGSLQITGQFDLPVGPAHRFYDIRVTNPDGSSALLPNRYEVT